MDSDLELALLLCAFTLAMGAGLWRLVHVRHSGPILIGMAVLAVVLILAAGTIPRVPNQVGVVGFVLAIVVTFGVLFWRHRGEDGDWSDVASVRYVKPVSRAERIGTAVVGIVLCYAIIGPDIPVRVRVAAGSLLPIAFAIVVRGRPPRDRVKPDGE